MVPGDVRSIERAEGRVGEEPAAPSSSLWAMRAERTWQAGGQDTWKSEDTHFQSTSLLQGELLQMSSLY